MKNNKNGYNYKRNGHVYKKTKNLFISKGENVDNFVNEVGSFFYKLVSLGDDNKYTVRFFTTKEEERITKKYLFGLFWWTFSVMVISKYRTSICEINNNKLHPALIEGLTKWANIRGVKIAIFEDGISQILLKSDKNIFNIVDKRKKQSFTNKIMNVFKLSKKK